MLGFLKIITVIPLYDELICFPKEGELYMYCDEGRSYHFKKESKAISRMLVTGSIWMT
jgi:hypothetical protein